MKFRPGIWIVVAVVTALCVTLNACTTPVRILAHAEAGYETTCVLSDKGALSCVGASVGDGKPPANPPAWVQSSKTTGVLKAASLSIFNNNVCVISSFTAGANQVLCWNSDGNIKVPYALQVQQFPVINVTSLSVGQVAIPDDPNDQDACALIDSPMPMSPTTKKIICWQFEASPGYNGLHAKQVADSNGEFLTPMTQVSVGFGFACAVRADNAVFCWGINDAGQLGRGFVTAGQSLLPAAAIPGLKARTVSAGYNHACAVAIDSTVLCWGANKYGQLGNNQSQLTSDFPFPTPQVVVGLPGALTVSAGWQFTCATVADPSPKAVIAPSKILSNVACWGQNEFGKLARFTFIPTTPPLPVTHWDTPSPVNLGKPKLNYYVVSAGRDHACASGTYGGFHPSTFTTSPLGLFVACWGSDANGQLTDTKLSTLVP
jgi:alpha-tubulin suppressor-like RCC1 family protein